ncbi:MAG TPA: catalase HPII, partial [Acetobacteraceae bacterium]
ALARKVADGLGLEAMPQAAPPARKIVETQPSPALSILKNGPKDMKGRKLGVLVTDGTDAALLTALQAAVKAEGAMMELIAPKVGGVKTSDGKTIEAQQKVNGGPSVLYDAVVVLPSAEGAKLLSMEATAKDFVNDAYAHAKFIGYAETAKPLFQKAGLTEMDDGFVALNGVKDIPAFLQACRAVRYWPREAKVHAV